MSYRMVPSTDRYQVRPDNNTAGNKDKIEKKKDPGKEKGITNWDKARKESNKRRDGGDGKKGGGGANQTTEKYSKVKNELEGTDLT